MTIYRTADNCIAELMARPVPKGKVRRWIDDGQEGGWIEYVTPEEDERLDREELA